MAWPVPLKPTPQRDHTPLETFTLITVRHVQASTLFSAVSWVVRPSVPFDVKAVRVHLTANLSTTPNTDIIGLWIPELPIQGYGPIAATLPGDHGCDLTWSLPRPMTFQGAPLNLVLRGQDLVSDSSNENGVDKWNDLGVPADQSLSLVVTLQFIRAP